MKKNRIILFFIMILLAAALVTVLIIYLPHVDSTQDGGLSNDVILNEVMTSNKGSVPDENGDFYDWIELCNNSDSEADISGFGLSDDLFQGAKYVFPSGTKLPARGYIIVFCSGEALGSFHASFRLSSSDKVVLFDATGKTLNSIALRAVASGATLGRNPDNPAEWTEFSRPSPGYPNTDAGADAFEAALLEQEDIGVYINEFMASNITTIADKYGVYSDWIELYNANDKEVDLSGFGVSDTLSQPFKYRLPDGVAIAPHGYLVIFCSGNESAAGDEELHVPFSLRAYQEDVVLTSPKGRIVDSHSFVRQESDISMARTENGTGEFASCSTPTPGYPNTEEGYRQFTETLNAALGDVYISELMNMNASTHKAPDGGYYAWVELHNAGGAPVSLLGCGLTDNANNPAKWLFPDVTIAPGEYLVVFASGKNIADAQKKNDLHTNFNISSSGETVYLFNPDGVFMDKLASGLLMSGASRGRAQSGAVLYYAAPTPGGANGEGALGVTAMPKFLTPPGIFDGEIKVELSASPGETIYYTTDCTTPTKNAQAYTGPISVSKNTVIRAVAVRDGYVTGYSNSGTFLFRQDRVDHTLPVVTLVTDPKNLWDDNTGIYVFGANFNPNDEYPFASANFYQRGDHWERPACFSVFDDGGQQVFSQNVSIRIAGSYGRARAQKGFNILAREEYGDNRMRYPFFENRDFTEYKALVLRTGAQDQYAAKICDELSTGLLEGSDVHFLYQAYKPYVLYLNGEYWGVYFMKEKRNRFFVAQHENTDNNKDLDIMKATTFVTYGSSKEWLALMEYVKNHNLSDAQAYAYVEERVDILSFMDYMICEIYVRNSDYANIQYYKMPGGKWKWIYYDFCWSWASEVTHETLNKRLTSTVNCSPLLSALLKNATFKDQFVRRFAELMETVYAPERVLAKVDELTASIASEMAREREKFNAATFRGREQSYNAATYNGWLANIEKVRDFAQKRPDIVKQHLQKELNLSDAYMKEVFG